MFTPEKRNHWDVVIALVLSVAMLLAVERVASCIGDNGYPDRPKQTAKAD